MYLDWVKVVQLRILETSLLAVRVDSIVMIILIFYCDWGRHWGEILF